MKKRKTTTPMVVVLEPWTAVEEPALSVETRIGMLLTLRLGPMTHPLLQALQEGHRGGEMRCSLLFEVRDGRQLVQHRR